MRLPVISNLKSIISVKKVLFLLGVLEHQDIEWIISEGLLKTIKQKSILIERGVSSSYLYLVLSGSFVVLAGKKEAVEIAKVEHGEILGELSFIDARPPGVSVVARKDAEVLCIEKKSVKARLKSNPGFAGRFYYSLSLMLSHRLRKANQEVDDGYEADEIDENLMDNFHQAGSSFNRIVKEVRKRKASQ